MGEAFMARRNSGGFYRYENLLTFETSASWSSNRDTITITLPDGVTWNDLEDVMFRIGDYYSNSSFTCRKISETTIRMYGGDASATNYSDFGIDPSGNSLAITWGGLNSVMWYDSWSVLWLRRPI